MAEVVSMWRPLTCRVCRRDIPKKKGSGRPSDVCGLERCRTIRERQRQRKVCPRCLVRLAPGEDPLHVLCTVCRSEVHLSPSA